MYDEYATDIVDDRKVKERRAADEVLVVEAFCEPLVSEELWERRPSPAPRAARLACGPPGVRHRRQAASRSLRSSRGLP